MSNVLLTMTSIFSIHAPRMESDRIRPVCIHQNAFSILAPRMGSDPSNFVLHDLFLFQFSLPVWGATFIPFAVIVTYGFSILAPCVGSDYMATTYLSIFFNSHSPHGERLNQYVLVKLHFIFQFTLPTWRATKQTRNIDYSDIFSIHAPRMESDREANRRCICIHLFNSRSPHGERQRN